MNELSINLTSELGELDRINSELQAVIDKQNISFEQAMPLFLSAEEAFVNICSYAYPNSQGDIIVKIQYTSDTQSTTITVVFEDFGVAFDPKEFDDITNSEQNLKNHIPGGLGIHLIKQMTDSISYSRTDGKNIFSFSKTFGGDSI